MYLFETDKSNDTKMLHFFLIFGIILTYATTLWSIPADNVILYASDIGLNSKSSYTLELSIDKDIPATAIIVCEFPSSFELNNVIVAGSTTINGGFALRVKENKIILKRSGLGDVVKANSKVDIKFAEIKNPNIEFDDANVRIKITDDEERVIVSSNVKVNEKK